MRQDLRSILLHRPISSWLGLLFIAALIVPWCVFAAFTLTERQMQLRAAERNLAAMASAYGHAAALSNANENDDARSRDLALSYLAIAPGTYFAVSGLRHAPVRPAILYAHGTLQAVVAMPGGRGTVTATRDASAVLDDWRQIARAELIALIFRSAATVAVGLFLVKQARWRERLQERLTAAIGRAETANQAKSAFLANMSHELRTPLNAILGFADVIKNAMMGPVSDRYRQYAADIFFSGNHLLNLVDEILDLSKLEAGKFELQEDVVDLADLGRTALHLVESMAAKAGVALLVTGPSIGPFIRGDRGRLQQVLTNILSNAIKFTESGGRVHIAIRETGDGARLEVQDTGIGMTAEQSEKALELFGQIESSIAHKFKGTGLGLPIAKRFVELHGGKLVVKSQPDVGTVVTVTFPQDRTVEDPGPCR